MTTVPSIPLRRPDEPDDLNLTAWAVSAVALSIIVGMPSTVIWLLFVNGWL